MRLSWSDNAANSINTSVNTPDIKVRKLQVQMYIIFCVETIDVVRYKEKISGAIIVLRWLNPYINYRKSGYKWTYIRLLHE